MTTTGARAIRNIDPARSGISPWRAFKAKPEDWFDAAEIAKAKRYIKAIRISNIIQRVLNIVVDVAVIRSHFFPNLLADLGLHNWVLDVVVVLAVLAVIGIVTNIGFQWWQQMIYDKKWEFSNMTVGTFFADLAKSLPLGIVVNTLLILPLWAIIRTTEAWWVVGWLVFSLLNVGFALIYPKFVAPLFNKFKPLDDEVLHADLLSVAHGVGADIEKVEVEDASKRDKRDNAYVAGAGKTRRIVLFDTILDRPHEQIRWVSAHEIGHWKLGHMMKRIPTILVLILLDFAALKLVIESDWVLDFAGVGSLGEPAAIPLFLLLLDVPFAVLGLAAAYMSRMAEREADLFGLEAVPEPEAAMASLRSLHVDNLADLAPSLWKRLNHSHPPVAERLAMIQEWDRRTNGATSGYDNR
ncbi:MAG TPA: M48 family metallopeptidase [Acidimicrobiales bacterium]|nr:M48 family metallopeptidase [Acidimicrobiales bacterium]